MAKIYTVGIAGSTDHTRICAEALRASGQFHISWVVTPPPQPIGRKQLLTKNPLQIWAEEHRFPVVHVEGKLSSDLQGQLQPRPDFLLVVDFGYLVPKWLLEWPVIAPLNIHPSLLPKWRGSSPGQFVLLSGEKESAVTIMIMGAGLDTGPLLWQGSFPVKEGWTQSEYYQESFTLAAAALPQVMRDLAAGSLKAVPQPAESPTPIAKRFKKEDGFVAWSVVTDITGLPPSSSAEIAEHHTSPLLEEVARFTKLSWVQVINNAIHGLSPWPGVWTFLPTPKGIKRMKLLASHVENEKLTLDQVQIEGQTASTWNEVKTMYAE
jgi:methionyl-tRNA formyltransferase